VGTAKSIVESDDSSVLYSLAEDHHIYTAQPDVLYRLVAGCTLRHALRCVDRGAANYT